MLMMPDIVRVVAWFWIFNLMDKTKSSLPKRKLVPAGQDRDQM
jgi:hypothetical protein